MADITLSKAVRSNLLNLQSTAALMGKTQERLATGLKVNSALDNPTNFFTASALNSRASDLGQLLDSVSNAVQTIAAADQGISALTKLVETAQATARQALQTPATVDTAVAATAATVAGGAFTAVDFENSGGNDGSISFDIDIDNAGVQSISITYAEANAGSADAGAVTAAELAALIDTELNTAFGTTGVDYASVNGSGGIDITSSTTGATSEVTITNFAVANGASGSGLANGTDTGSTASTTSGANPKRDELRLQYNELLGQIDQLVNDAGFNGVNLLDGDDLSVLFNEDGSSKLDIAGVTLDSSGLGLSTIASSGFNTDTAINSTLDDLSDAIDTLRTQASTFGANLSVVETRQDFTKNMINVLETGAANLTLADTNEEAANLLALQTRQQLSSTALSLASQADQQVLRLF
jgi:flagellin